jgi:hypothetical protein
VGPDPFRYIAMHKVIYQQYDSGCSVPCLHRGTKRAIRAVTGNELSIESRQGLSPHGRVRPIWHVPFLRYDNYLPNNIGSLRVR